MDILILAHYCGPLDGKGNSRFLELAGLLAENHRVEVITTDFLHEKKSHITASANKYPFQLTLLHERGYPKNVCPQRLVSHREFGRNVAQYLETRKKPDVVYCAVPDLDAPLAAARYCQKNGVRFLIDVQDLWPEAFRMVFHVPIVSDLIFAPMEGKADRIYAAADTIIAVSETYCQRALSVNQKCPQGHCVYLGTRLERFNALATTPPTLQKPAGTLWLAYIGTLGHSYDLTGVLDTLALLRERQSLSNLQFLVMGDGPLREKFEAYAQSLDLPVLFTGMLSYDEMVPLLCACDMAVNPIAAGSAGSIINKVCDYAAAGLPVINTQECPEYRELVVRYELGINCENGNTAELADAIQCLAGDEMLRRRMGANDRRLAQERFDRAHSYQKIIRLIEGT